MFANYNEADQFLGKKTNRPYPHGRATRVIRTESGDVGIRYHETVVVEYTPTEIILNSGGWHTKTTKERINDALGALARGKDRFPVNAYVGQTQNVWYLFVGNLTQYLPFFDGIRIAYDGTVTNKPTVKEINSQFAENKRRVLLIRKYARDLKAKLESGDFALPGPGDCWYCYFVRNDGTPLGEFDHHYHLLQHVEESYFVPSLIFYVTRQRGSIAAQQGLYHIASKEIGHNWFADIAVRDVPRIVRRYLLERLINAPETGRIAKAHDALKALSNET